MREIPNLETLSKLHTLLLTYEDERVQRYLLAVEPGLEEDVVVLSKLSTALGMLYGRDVISRGHGRHIMNKFWAGEL